VAQPPQFDHDELASAVADRFGPPELPTAEGWTFAGLSVPAHTGSALSGDWFDAVRLPDGVLLVVGDVMGKGARAVPDMSQLRTGVRALALAVDDLGQLLMAMDRLHDVSASLHRFATAVLMKVPVTGGTVSISSAGHLPPLLIHADGRSEVVEVPVGPPIGVPAEEYRVVEVEVPVGATLLAGSDGVIEAERGTDGIAAAIGRAEAAAGEPLASLLVAVAANAAGIDDVTLLGARRDA
jgi:two-component system, chemotaxis family, sensor kinase Cph1